jgi:hypothetical protein
MYLIIRALERRRGLTQIELLCNALDLTAEAARHDLDVREKRRALALLDQVDPANPLLAPIREMLHRLDAIPASPPRWPARTALRCRTAYLAFADTRTCTRLVIAVISIWGVLSLISTFLLVLSLGLHLGGAAHGAVSDDIGHLSVLNWASLASSTTSGVFVVLGIMRLRSGDRDAAYRLFERALLVSIFITRTFAFVESQFGAVFGLSIDLILLITLGLMMKGERQRQELTAAPSVLGAADSQLAVGELAR